MPIVNPAAKRGSTKAAINASTSTGAAIYPRDLGLPAYYRSGITEITQPSNGRLTAVPAPKLRPQSDEVEASVSSHDCGEFRTPIGSHPAVAPEPNLLVREQGRRPCR